MCIYCITVCTLILSCLLAAYIWNIYHTSISQRATVTNLSTEFDQQAPTGVLLAKCDPLQTTAIFEDQTTDSRLDFCNSLLAGTSVSNLARLQRVQNTLTRVVAQKPRFCHITPVLSDLHWLPVRHRISFETLLLLTYRVLQFQQPSYLASLIPRHVPTGTSTPLFFVFVNMYSHT